LGVTLGGFMPDDAHDVGLLSLLVSRVEDPRKTGA